MGRIKTRLVKRSTRELLKQHGEEVAADYVENKKIVQKYVELSSKKLRNIMAGYATRLAKQRKPE
ncbi:30S ribosomal protein S17e [Candidatus Woesearchaeota archaeon]|nr:30S ribosomal protein S17e [Candidatus Woesearchaeota archaeon]